MLLWQQLGRLIIWVPNLHRIDDSQQCAGERVTLCLDQEFVHILGLHFNHDTHQLDEACNDFVDRLRRFIFCFGQDDFIK